MGVSNVLNSVFYSTFGKAAEVRNNGANTQTCIYLLRYQNEVIR
ncbi:MAG: hypothetical protein ABF651_05530 [Sporolactobacillus sp.]